MQSPEFKVYLKRDDIHKASYNIVCLLVASKKFCIYRTKVYLSLIKTMSTFIIITTVKGIVVS